jgi:hypothetical protein
MRGQQFERGGALPGDDPGIGVGMHDGRAGVGLHACAGGLARVDGRCAAMQDCARAFDRRELGLHRALRHHDVTGDAAHARGQRQRRAVVAGRMRGDAARRDLVRQRPYCIAGAAELERTDPAAGARP